MGLSVEEDAYHRWHLFSIQGLAEVALDGDAGIDVLATGTGACGEPEIANRRRTQDDSGRFPSVMWWCASEELGNR